MKCRYCDKDTAKYEMIRFEDLSGWCSSDCFRFEPPEWKEWDYDDPRIGRSKKAKIIADERAKKVGR